jgi:hypothetical protein
MVREARGSTTMRTVFVALTALALALRLLFPSGFMPGNSLARPIVLCDGQGPMTGMAAAMPDTGHHHTGKQTGKHGGKTPSHDEADRECPFASLAATPTAPAPSTVAADPVATVAVAYGARPLAAAPGRGLAAPPPPSHAPPPLRA